MIASVLLNLPYWIGIALIVSRLLSPRDWVEQVMTTVLVGFVGLVVGCQVLSLFGLLAYRPALMLSSGVLAAGLLFRLVPRSPAAQQAKDPSVDDQENSLSTITVVLSTTLALWIAFKHLLRGIVLPVDAVSDAPIYHLYFAVRWWQAQSIEWVMTPFGELAAPYFPANGDLWLTWLVLGNGNETLAKVGQWPFLILSALAIFGIGKRLGIDTAASALTANLWLSFPLAHYYAEVANVDLVYTFGYLCGAYFLVGALKDPPSPRDWVLCGLALGLAAGTKTIALLFTPLLILPALILLVVRRRWLVILGAAAAFLTACGFWYVRTWLATGNPLYPLNVSLFGWPLFHGWFDRAAMLQTAYHYPTENLTFLLDRLTFLLDAQAAWLWPAAGLAALVGVKLARGSFAWQAALGFWTVSALYLAAYWWVLPYNTQERFLAPALALGLVPVMCAANRRVGFHLFLLLLMCVHVFFPQWRTLLSSEKGPWIEDFRMLIPLRANLQEFFVPLSLLIAVAVLVKRPRIWTAAFGVLLVSAASLLTILPALAQIEKRPYLGFYPRINFAARLVNAWQVADEASGPDGARIAYAGSNLPYYLHGLRLRNDVRYVNVNAPLDWKMHDYHQYRANHGETTLATDPWPTWYRDKPDFDVWWANLKKAKIDLLFVARENLHGKRTLVRLATFPIEQQWAKSHPERFVPVRHDLLGRINPPWAWVYRVKRD